MTYLYLIIIFQIFSQVSHWEPFHISHFHISQEVALLSKWATPAFQYLSHIFIFVNFNLSYFTFWIFHISHFHISQEVALLSKWATPPQPQWQNLHSTMETCWDIIISLVMLMGMLMMMLMMMMMTKMVVVLFKWGKLTVFVRICGVITHQGALKLTSLFLIHPHHHLSSFFLSCNFHTDHKKQVLCHQKQNTWQNLPSQKLKIYWYQFSAITLLIELCLMQLSLNISVAN